MRDRGVKARANSSGLASGLAAVSCVGIALFWLFVGLSSGGVPPETALFGVLALIFAAHWWATRRRARRIVRRGGARRKDAATGRGQAR